MVIITLNTNTNNIAIEQIAAALAHEVKNPLTLAKATIDLLEAGDENPNNKKNYNIIRSELNKINELMLEFINITTPSNPENYKHIYPADILNKVIKRYLEPYKNKVTFAIHNNCHNYALVGAEKSIEILFNNIIKNSLDAIEKNGIITVYIEEDNNNLIITITDNGKGIPPHLESLVGNNFFTTKEFGSGLGLHICKKIIQDHKGSFKIINNYGLGCTVKVILPLYKNIP